MTYTNTQRKILLRKAVKGHSGWKSYRQNAGVDLGTMTMDDLEKAHNTLFGQTFDTAQKDYQNNEVDAEAWNNGDYAVFEEDVDLAEYDRMKKQERAQKAEYAKAVRKANEHIDEKEKAAKATKTGKGAEVVNTDIDDVDRQILDLINSKRKGDIDRDMVVEIVKDVAGELVAKAAKEFGVVRLEIKKDGKTTYQTEEGEAVHPMFDKLVKALSAKQANGDPINIWLAGPTGSGKTHAASAAAKALDLDFFMQGAMKMAHELVGFVDANGNYHETQFVKAFRNGGVCLLDELDAGDNEALLAVNAALANGKIALPNGEILQRHTDFHCIGAANTFGSGATADFIGRCKIDAAFLSRFPVKLYWDYDEKLERAISGNPDFAIMVQKARQHVQDAGIKIIVDPRHSQAGAALIASGFSEREAAELTFLSAMTEDQKKIVRKAIKI